MNLLIDEERREQALLVLDDGTAFAGFSCGATGEAFGEIVYDTDAFGYQAAACAPENEGKLVVFTYPQIGNHGVNGLGACPAAAAAGVVVHDMVYTPSSWASEGSYPEFLAERGVVAIEDVDTRALTAAIRDAGRPVRAAISTTDLDPASLAARLAEGE